MIRGTEEFLKSYIKELNLEHYQFKKYDSTYRLVISMKTEVKKFLDIYNYSDFYLQRKWDKIQDRLNIWNSSLVQTISST